MSKTLYCILTLMTLGALTASATEISHWRLDAPTESLTVHANIIGFGVGFQEDGALTTTGTTASFNVNSYPKVPYKEPISFDNHPHSLTDKTNNSILNYKKGK
jgi:hypothetical protein